MDSKKINQIKKQRDPENTYRDTTYEHFYDMLTGGEIKYPEVAGNHKATNVRYPILKNLFARYLNGENVYNQ